MNQDPRDARIEELEAENRRLRRFLDETGLPAELRHKVRNTLSMLRAIIRRSAETSDSLETYVAHLDGRLDALARVLNALMRSVKLTFSTPGPDNSLTCKRTSPGA